MNKIVLEHYPASKLPPELREGLAEDASVTVTVQEEAPKPISIKEHRRRLEEYRNAHTHRVSLEEAVIRVRELRDEWDD